MTESKTKKRVTKRLTDDEKILGIQPEEKETEVVNYESIERKYKVTGLHVGATPVLVNGTVIETFIGSTNKVARNALINGAKEVITFDGNGKEAYKIEVIN
jgi:hypothetical protein